MKKLIIGGLFGICAGLIAIFLSSDQGYLFQNLFRNFEYISLDTRFKFKGTKPKDSIDDIVIVDIDNQSMDELGRWQDWSRSYYTKVIDYISSGKPKAIALDILFPEYSKDKKADNELFTSTEKVGNVIHSFYFDPRQRRKEENLDLIRKYTLPLTKGKFFENATKTITLPVPEIQEKMAGLGYDNKYEEEGIVRHYNLLASYEGKFSLGGKSLYEKRLYPSLAFAAILQALKLSIDKIKIIPGKCILLGEKKIPIDEMGRMLIRYHGERGVIRYISFSTVFFEKIPRKYFEDKVVLLGGSAEGLFDITANPYVSVYPGVEVHATVIHNILNNYYLLKTSKWLRMAIILISGIIIGLISSVCSLKRGGILSGFILFGYIITAFIFFETKGLWLEMVPPSFSMGFTFLTVWLWRFQTEEKEKRKVRGMFSRYVSKDVVEQLVSNPDAFSIGGKRVELSVLFSDICGFTTLSEKLQAEEIVSLLNEYFTAMNQVIFKHKGTLDKYIGDAIMVFYGAPLYPEDHAKRAVLTALDMIKELNRLKKEWKARGKEELDIGIGINTGEAVVGNIGSDIQTNYTVIGDEVNLASRLEGMTRKYDAQIIISKATYEKIKDEILSREVDLIVVKGKTKPVMIYEPIGLINEVGDDKKKQLEVFQNGLSLYKEKKWKEAANVFSTIMEDGVSRMYFMRCQDYIVSPPPADWDGVYVYKTK
ncbi:MAG: adenylate/guanylate cyclase domain-containing protein [bacterium]